jgi:hypothetical protein
MLEFLHKKVYQQIHRIIHCTHELHKFDLANLYNEDRSSMLINRVEPVRTKLLDVGVLIEIVVLQQ